MTQEIFNRHTLSNPHLTFYPAGDKFIAIESGYNDKFGTYNVFKRQFYEKSNGKTCYVDVFVKQITVDKNKCAPSSNGYSFRIRSKYFNEILTANNIS